MEGIARGAIEPDNRATVVRSIIPGRLLIGGGKDPADSRRGIGARAAQAGSNELPLPLRSLKNIHTLVGQIDPNKIFCITLISLEIDPSSFDLWFIIVRLRPCQ